MLGHEAVEKTIETQPGVTLEKNGLTKSMSAAEAPVKSENAENLGKMALMLQNSQLGSAGASESTQKHNTVKSMHAGKKTVANAIIYDASEAATSHNTNAKKWVKSSTKKA